MKDYVKPHERANEKIINAIMWMDIIVLLIAVAILVYILIT